MSQQPRYAETFCSQCGSALGPGDEGVSRCFDHKNVIERAIGWIEEYTPMRDGELLADATKIIEDLRAFRAAQTPPPGKWGVVSLLRKPGESRANYMVRRVVWTPAGPISEYLRTEDGSAERTFGPDSYADACAVVNQLNGTHGVRESDEGRR
jgi:hypothetical protein